jgi:hypothetical protein
MFTAKDPKVEQHLKNLEKHLSEENPVLLSTVKTFRQLDWIARRIGFLDEDESYAMRVPWWPLVSVLGTFSAGKSTFINHYLGMKLQITGTQAVDEKFTVLTFSNDQETRTLPGMALDGDSRFPFYRISREIDEVATGEGQRIDAYLQLKTCLSERLRNKIVIDSPGFDADAQRTSTLRITKYIVDLSDLVLVFFDARHPEPGAMQDTLQHLVEETIHRVDSNKFLYILNQIDTTAREDNPEEVVAAWQRALAQRGLTAGRFYRIYSPEAAFPIENPRLRERFEAKRDEDLANIYERMHQVEVERAYRVIGVLEKTARDIEEKVVPRIRHFIERWRQRVLWTDGAIVGFSVLAIAGAITWLGGWDTLATLWSSLAASPIWQVITGSLVLAALVYMHFSVRKLAARQVIKTMQREMGDHEYADNYANAFMKNARYLRSLFMNEPSGWSKAARQHLHEILSDANVHVQRLNDAFTNPSGKKQTPQTAPESPGEEPIAAQMSLQEKLVAVADPPQEEADTRPASAEQPDQQP